MKFQTLNIENFLAIGKASVRLDDRGLVLIQGANDDDTSALSNGAGKSSIADALCWCLFGTTARGESGDAIINNKAGKGTRVSLVLEDGGDQYEIARHRKHKTGKNTLTVLRFNAGVHPPVWDELTKGTDKLTQEVVLQLIGSSYDVFRASIYAGQESMPDLPAMADKALKVLVEEASGVTVLEKAYEEARSRASVIRAERETVALRRDRLVAQCDDAKGDIVHADDLIAAHETSRKEKIEDFATRARKHAEEVRKAAAELAAMTVSETDATAEIDKIDAEIAAVGAERDKERLLAQELSKVERAQALAHNAIKTLVAEANREKASLDGISHRIGCPCDECGRPYTSAEIAPAQKLATEKLRKTLDAVAAAKLDAEAHDKRVLEARESLEKHRASMTDISSANARRASLQAVLAQAKAIKDRIELARREIENLKKMIDAEKVAVNPHLATKERAEKKLASAVAELTRVGAEISEITERENVAKAVVDVFSPTGVRAHILDQVTPFLNAQTAKYLGTLSDGNLSATWSTLSKTAKGEWREKFAIEVVNATGGGSFGLISGGEKRKVRIACALALQDLVASRATKPIELFIGDEIDDALDVSGVERLMAILEEKARERGTVLVVSHSDLKDWISQVMVVTKKGGVSEIEEVTA